MRLVWLLAPLGWRRGLTIAPFFSTELLLGNIYVFFAGVLVLAVVRMPGVLALPILTKISPGVVAIWFLVRHEWRGATQLAGVTALVIAISASVAPSAWVTWVRFLEDSAPGRGGAIALRLTAAVIMVIWAANSGRAWVLAPAVVLASPILGGFGPFSVLAAVPRLLAFEQTERALLGGRPDGTEESCR